jgi:hypothetical protein
VAGWDQVKWTQARQIAELMDIDPAVLGDPDADPQDGYRKLRDSDDLPTAIRYLGHALPRLEAIAWASHLLQSWSRKQAAGSPERQALDSVQRWLEEPGDEYRRAAHEAGERAGAKSPERLLANAVFMSGGSISEPDLPAVQPPQQVCGSLAASAVLVAAYGTASPKAALADACSAGEKVATSGIKGLPAP